MLPRSRRLLICAIILLVAGTASAKEVSKANFTNPNPFGLPFRDCASSGIFAASGSAWQIKLKALTTDGSPKSPIPDTDQLRCTSDDYICVIHTLNNVEGKRTYVFRGDVKKGALTIKHDLCKEAGLCGGAFMSSFLRDTQCYEADAAFAPAFDDLLPPAKGVDCAATPELCCEGVITGLLVLPGSTLIAREGNTDGCP